MSDFHRSLDAALHGEPRWAAVSPLLPGNPDDYCPTCGTRIRDNRAIEPRICPFAPHDDDRTAA